MRPIDRMRVEKKPPIGRPLKYRAVLASLDDHELYSAGTITLYAVARELIENTFLAKTRLRITLSRFSRNHRFPIRGDGVITMAGQAPIPGYWGHRWKIAAGILEGAS